MLSRTFLKSRLLLCTTIFVRLSLFINSICHFSVMADGLIRIKFFVTQSLPNIKPRLSERFSHYSPGPYSHSITNTLRPNKSIRANRHRHFVQLRCCRPLSSVLLQICYDRTHESRADFRCQLKWSLHRDGHWPSCR